ncbi:MAG: hypothetical protein ABI614_28090, partial [Planctomycetota bacterium]
MLHFEQLEARHMLSAFQGLGFEEAGGVSADGRVIVGMDYSENLHEATRWEAGTISKVGSVPGTDY